MTVATNDLEQLAVEAARDLAGQPAEEIVHWAAEHFAGRIAVASSMQDAVLVHLVAAQLPDVPVLFLDTGYHFAETIGTRDAVEASYPIKLLNLTAVQSVPEQDAAYGPRLHDRDPDLCCRLRKVEPLNEALTGFDAWFTGIRRDDAPTREGVPVVQWDAKRHMVKVNPLAEWTLDELMTYADDNNVIVNPLFGPEYPSIGCAPCTRAVAPGEHPRAGRWAGKGKTECGLHT